MKEKDVKTLKILNWLYDYHVKNQTTHIYDETLKNQLLIGELGYSDHTTITNWITLIRIRYFDINGELNVEKVIADGEQLTAKQNESIDKKNRMLQQWVKDSESNSKSNSKSNNESTNQPINQPIVTKPINQILTN